MPVARVAPVQVSSQVHSWNRYELEEHHRQLCQCSSELANGLQSLRFHQHRRPRGTEILHQRNSIHRSMGVSKVPFLIYCYTKTISRRPQRGTIIGLRLSISLIRGNRWACSPSHCTYHICELFIFQWQYDIRNRDPLAYYSKRSQLHRELLELVYVSTCGFSIFHRYLNHT